MNELVDGEDWRRLVILLRASLSLGEETLIAGFYLAS